MTVRRGQVVRVRGVVWNVIAVRDGIAWLASDVPWRPLLVIPAKRCARVPGCFVASTPWEIN